MISNYVCQKGGIEHAIQSLRAAFKNTECDAILLISAKNAFNGLNRDLALNIEKLCPSLFHSICKSYRGTSNLFINKQTILCEEGRTQGAPLVMPMYGIAIIALIELLDACFIVKKWYLDDVNPVGSRHSLKTNSDELKKKTWSRFRFPLYQVPNYYQRTIKNTGMSFRCR